MLSKKDIISVNQEFHTGKLSNESSLDYAISLTHRSKNWLRTCAVLGRAIIIDHVFEDGNKRTAAGIIMTVMEMNNITYSEQRVYRSVLQIAKKNPRNLIKIEEAIKNARD
ncbi:MAG: hypothetical protein AABX47_03055 [Nanoarchaeota archaeon]